MSNQKQNLEHDKVEAFFKSPLGFWVSVAIGAGIVLGSIGITVVGWFQ